MRLQILKSKFDSYFGFMVISFLLVLISFLPLLLAAFFTKKHKIEHGTTIFPNWETQWHDMLIYETKDIFLVGWICSGTALFLGSFIFILIFSALTVFFVGLYLTTGVLGSMDLAILNWVQDSIQYVSEHLFGSKAKVQQPAVELLKGVKNPVEINNTAKAEPLPKAESYLGYYILIGAILLFILERWE